MQAHMKKIKPSNVEASTGYGAEGNYLAKKLLVITVHAPCV